MTIHNCRVRDFGSIDIPEMEYGDLRLQVFPITHGESVKLPGPFSLWNETADTILNRVPVQDGARKAFVTVDSRWFPVPERLRREGIHMDGNFCADPTFRREERTLYGWGGGGWSGLRAVKDHEEPDNSHVEIGFRVPYNLGVIPIGKYVSDNLGATIVATTYEGCEVWPGTYSGNVGEGGDWSEMVNQLGVAQNVPAYRMFAMSSNTPHQSMITPAGVRRTLIRVTMPHNWNNESIFQ